MKIFASVLVASLLFVAVQPRPVIDTGPTPSDSADAMLTPIVAAQVYLPGECCNNDFRQAVPRWEYPLDTTIAKP
jgi:hypothetical protein